MLVAPKARGDRFLTLLYSGARFIPCPAFWWKEPLATVSGYLNRVKPSGIHVPSSVCSQVR